MTFSTTWFPSHEDVPPPLEVRARISETLARSRLWAGPEQRLRRARTPLP